MATRIVGVNHNLKKIVSLLPKLLKEIDSQVAEIEGKKVKVGVESTQEHVGKSWLWRKVVEHLRKNSKVEIVFLDSPKAIEIGYKYQFLAKRIKFGHTVPKEELKKFDKMEYVIVELRDKHIQKAIEKKQTQLNILGSKHAYTIGKKLKVTPTYVGTTAFDAKLSAELMRSGHYKIEKQQKRKQRKRKISRLLKKIVRRKK